jgi:formate hydrogenlyase subunit 3/multisubunit Na+/H+ antiporter MnhD subunit
VTSTSFSSLSASFLSFPFFFLSLFFFLLALTSQDFDVGKSFVLIIYLQLGVVEFVFLSFLKQDMKEGKAQNKKKRKKKEKKQKKKPKTPGFLSLTFLPEPQPNQLID